MMNPIDEIVGRNIKEKRVLAGLSQAGLGERIGVTFQQIQKYENGSNRVFASRLVQLANALGVPVTDLFGGIADEMKAIETRTLAEMKREGRVVEGYRQMPEEIQEAIAVLTRAIVLGLGQTFKRGSV